MNSLTVAALVCSTLSLTISAQDFPLKKLKPLTTLVDYEASWSPDGKKIVLISSRHGGLKVHVFNADDGGNGSNMQQITTGPEEDDSPVWSPDGRKIAFVSIRNSVSHIFLMDADGSNIHQLTNGVGQNIHPAWSPDGAWILFNTTRFAASAQKSAQAPAENRIIGEKTDDDMELAKVRPDGSELTRITHGGGYTYASFSPDGKLIVHRRQQGETSQVFLMNADGSGDHNLSATSTLDGWPSWSPDGERIVFSRHGQNGFQIFEMNRDGSSVRQLTDAVGEYTNPRWSPDGTKILCGRRLGGTSLVVFQAPS